MMRELRVHERNDERRSTQPSFCCALGRGRFTPSRSACGLGYGINEGAK